MTPLGSRPESSRRASVSCAAPKGPREHASCRPGCSPSACVERAPPTALSPPVAPPSPHPQLDHHRAVVGELLPDGLVGPAVGDVAEGGAVDPGHHPPVDHVEQGLPAACRAAHLRDDLGVMRFGAGQPLGVWPHVARATSEPRMPARL
jgi:hypothetical protein